ncbi:MAG TPA: single-stranded DNA-binding protein [Pyrinomonadaceae bacterium]|nr:single-stranded DNA-binding protein [Pyrinomonadaceae bacterium]
MSNVNKTIIMGRLGNDPETRYTKDGTAVTEISVATSEKWKDKDGQQQEHTEWHKVVFWGRQAEIAGEYLRKGHLVYLEGHNRTEKWTDKDGVDRWTTKIRASELKLMPNGDREERGNSGGQRGGRREETAKDRYGPSSGGPSPKREAPPKQNDFADDDIPFS